MNMRQGQDHFMDDSVPAMVWRARPDMSCEYLSRPWLEFTGYTQEQALGDGWSRGVHPEDLGRWLEACVRAFDARSPFDIEYRLRRRDGEYRWVLDRGVPRYGADGAFLGYVGSCVDIDEHKRAETGIADCLARERKLRRASEEAIHLRDGLLHSMLEDLRPPLRGIMDCVSQLRRQVPEGSDSARALDAIEAHASTQQRVIGRLPGETRLAGVKVLLVDDEPRRLERDATVLGLGGAQTRTAACPSEALQLYEGWEPDAVVIDAGMRWSAAFVLLRALKARPLRDGARPVRAVALVPQGDAQAAAQAAELALASGFDTLLERVPEAPVLVEAIARLVCK